MVADATARPAAEREIDHRIRLGPALRGKAPRIKFLRFCPETFVPMEMEDGHDHVHPPRYLVAAQLILLGATPPNRPDGRKHPQRFFDDLSRVAERADVLVRQALLRPACVDLRH